MPASAQAWLSKSATELHEVYRGRALSPLELVSALMDAVADDASTLNAFCLLDRDGALSAAESSAKRWRAGTPLGPLDGIPVSIKDMFDVAGWPTRRGSRVTAGAPPAAADAPSVALLRRGGAAFVVDLDATRGDFGRWFSRSVPGYSPAAVEAFWSRRGWHRRELDLRMVFTDRADLEAVLRIEFTPEVAAEAIAETPGLVIDYPNILRWRVWP